MMNILKRLIFEFRLLLANEYDRAKLYTDYMGIEFGKGVRITGKPIFGSEPYLIKIGDNVTITHGVIFHCHDGGVGLFRDKYPGIDVIKPIKIGNNVFIGSNVTIMPGITVGSNVVIGASSVITKNVADNVVVVGIPAKVIKTIEEYEEKILSEAVYLENRNNKKKRIREIKNALNLE